jgi:hypothetical protein
MNDKGSNSTKQESVWSPRERKVWLVYVLAVMLVTAVLCWFGYQHSPKRVCIRAADNACRFWDSDMCDAQIKRAETLRCYDTLTTYPNGSTAPGWRCAAEADDVFEYHACREE